MAHRAPAGIAERRVALVAEGPLGAELADGLRRHGVAVVAVTPGTAYDEGLRAATDAVGRLDAVVWAATPPGLAVPTPLAELPAQRWEELVGDTLRGYVEFLQAAQRVLRGRRSGVVVVVPTIALSGAAGLVAWAAVADGQRALAKSVARVWGRDGIRVNCVAVPAALLAGADHDLDRPAVQQAALDEPDLGRDVAGAVAALFGDKLASVTGATLGVDGGRWMPA